jgi:hypothetical protein
VSPNSKSMRIIDMSARCRRARGDRDIIVVRETIPPA